MVKHSTQHPKVQGLKPPIAAGTGKETMPIFKTHLVESVLLSLKLWIFFLSNYFKITSQDEEAAVSEIHIYRYVYYHKTEWSFWSRKFFGEWVRQSTSKLDREGNEKMTLK